MELLSERQVRPVGTNSPVKVDVRVIAATNRDLEAEYQAGRFRKDLYFRLNVVTVGLPALRERKSDIHMLVQCFLDRFAPKKQVELSPAVMRCLLQYEWPGNVRELENCIERAIALGNHELIDLHDLPPAIRRAAAEDSVDAKPALSATDLEDLERMTIERVFDQVKGDKMLAGKMLGISRATLYRKLKRYGIGMGPQGCAPEKAMTAGADNT